jgi:alpha-L-fucosidase
MGATDGELDKVVETQGWEAWFANNPYAEWYSNSMRIADSPTQRRHIETYGSDFAYDDFVPIFDAVTSTWNPEEWVKLFKRAGARYVVPVTKHHDGFLLWPSPRTAPGRDRFRPSVTSSVNLQRRYERRVWSLVCITPVGWTGRSTTPRLPTSRA